MSQANTNRNRRICVLVRGQEWDPVEPGRACLSHIHGHMTEEKVERLVADGLAEWITVEKTRRGGKVTQVTVLAIRLIPKRRWKGKVSGGPDGRPMRVMQLVR